jgi:hypothetical protein
MQQAKYKKLVNRLVAEAADFNAASWHNGIAGTAMNLFGLERRTSMTWDDLALKLAEILKIPEDIARAIELPAVPPERLKYVPAFSAVAVLHAAAKGNDAAAIQQQWKEICDVHT